LTQAVEQKIAEMTHEFFQILPYDFGAKKPPSINHWQRVKERVKQMDMLTDIVQMEKAISGVRVCSYLCV
jgi:hypothetical protein